MADIQTVLKAEIARIARKEIRLHVEPLKKAASQHRAQVSALKRQVEDLQKALHRMGRSAARQDAPASDDVDAGPARRFSASRLAKTRQKLGLSAADFGALIGVSGQSIYKWESGEVRPRAAQLEAIAQVRHLGKREAAAKLEELQQQAATPARKRA